MRTKCIMKREVSAHCLAACFVAMAWLGLSPTAQAGSITNVVPGSGPFAGGNSITIQGTSLGNGSDITNVVLHGATATIQPGQTTGRVSVLAGPALAWGTGDVAVASASLGTTVLTNGYCYSAAGDIHGASLPWTTIGTLPAPREYVMAASVSNVIYLIGGAGSYDGGSATTVYKFDTAHPWVGWSSVSNLPVGMQGGAAVSVGSTIYVLGGGGSANSGSASVYKYDTAQPALGWVSVSSLPAARWRLGAAVVNGRIYVTGGSDNSWNNYPDCWVYDTAHPANGWTAISNLPYSIGTHGCEAANGKVYVFGGINSSWTYLSTVYEYDPAQPARGWVRLPDLPEPRAYTKSAHLNGRIYCISGNNHSSQTSGILEFDTAAPERGWVSVASLPQNGWTDQATVGAGGNLYAMGGDWNYSQTENAVQEGQWMPGVLPTAGPVTGGNSVAISGTGLGNGTDVTNVTLCGFAAAISSQTATQVLVTASTATGITNGDAIVQSVSRGAATCAGGYTYHDHDLVVLGTNGMAITNNEAATVAKGTQFQRRPLGTQISFVFALQNAGGPLLHITGVSTSGVGASQFAVGGVPATIAGHVLESHVDLQPHPPRSL